MTDSYILTGEPELDKMLGSRGSGGIRMGSVFIVRGEPGSGKTTLALQILDKFLRSSEKTHHGLLLSLEEDAEQLCRRMSGAYGFSLETPKDNLHCASTDDVREWIQKMALEEEDDKLSETICDTIADLLKEAGGMASLNPLQLALMASAGIARIPAAAATIAGLLKKRADETASLQGHRLLVIDSLNALINVLSEHFPKKRSPRVILNALCRALRGTFGDTATILFTSEYHYQMTETSRAISESFYCDTDIMLRPEPVRVPASYEPSIQSSVGYNLNALIHENSDSIESRSFCRVTKARWLPNQARRCAYDIIPEKGIKFYPTYPGDGKVVLFAENQPQKDAWEAFVKYDVPESYPALRTRLFDRMSMQTVFEGQRRLRNVPLKTDMYLASFDSYWVSWYRNYKLRCDIEEALRKGASNVNSLPEEYPHLINSLMRLFKHCKSGGNKLGWKDIADFMSLSHFGPLIKEMYGDGTWEHWIELERKALTEGGNGPKTFRHKSPFLDTINEIYKKLANHPAGSSFLMGLPKDQLRLFGETRSKPIRDLEYKGLLGEHWDPSKELCVPYDANVGLLVCREDIIRNHTFRREDVSEHLKALYDKEAALMRTALRMLDRELGSGEAGEEGDAFGLAAHLSAKGRRTYRLRVHPAENCLELVGNMEKMLLLGCGSETAQKLLAAKEEETLKDTLGERENPEHALLSKCFDARYTRSRDCGELLKAVGEELVRDWASKELQRILTNHSCQPWRTAVAETLEKACRASALRSRFDRFDQPEYQRCSESMRGAAAERIADGKLPKTWEEIIAICKITGKKMQIEWQTFDSFVCSFLELAWSCGGKSIEVREDYEIVDWDTVYVQLLKALFLFNEFYGQNIAPRTAVTVHKPKAFQQGVAGSKDWVFARHWYSTLIELLTTRGEDGELLYPDEQGMKLTIMPIPVSLTAWADDLARLGNEDSEPVLECHKRGQVDCLPDTPFTVDGLPETTSKETGDDRKQSVSYLPPGLRCPNDKECKGCPRPLAFSCWGEWSFGVVSGSENDELALDLINNMMSSLKILKRAFTGAALPTVEAFYELYGNLPCVDIPERRRDSLPRDTFNDIKRTLFSHAKSRREIYDFRHCGKLIHAEIDNIRKAGVRLSHEQLVRRCGALMRDIEELYSARILMAAQAAT